jgi:tetratricopeptide (TPR) repeat protein
LHVLQVNCEAPGSSGGALEEARHKVEQLLGEALLPAERFEIGLRHRFLGDLPVHPVDAVLVEECNRLADRMERRAVLVFEAIDTADEPTVATLIQILQRPGWLRLPLVLTVRGMPQGRVAELVALVRREDTEKAVLEIADDTSSGGTGGPFAWATLPPDVLRVLRAGAVLGATFDADLIARLLDEPLGTVLEKLQWAADAGVPLVDRGERRFALPTEAVGQLQHGILPSLLTFWHARLGTLLSGGQAMETTAMPEPHRIGTSGAVSQRVPPDHPSTWPEELFEVATPRPPAAAPAGRTPGRDAETIAPTWRAEPPRATPLEQAMAGVDAAPVAAAREQPWEARHTQGRTDQTRAAAHLQAAGHTEAAAAQYLAAVRETAARGDARRAYALAGQALQLLDGLPMSSQRALLRAQLLLEMGRLQWHGALLGSSFTLHDALRSLETARSSLPTEAPADVMGNLATVTAGVCYDLGDLDALQRALADLTAVSRLLLNVGEPVAAARLLNDQAAIYMRLGDPVQASHLLSRSRELFEKRTRDNPNDAVAVEELAETEHLFARLPLHAQLRPGREEDAYAMGLDHAQAAERAYQRLGQRGKVARVWETRGRLELGRRRLEAAHQSLAAAIELQQQLGDVMGLARSTAALADLYMAAGRPGDAVALLADSIALNVEKGSPIGLAFNRRTFGLLSRAAAQAHGAESERLQSAMEEVEGRLTQAEAALGRLILPGEMG